MRRLWTCSLALMALALAPAGVLASQGSDEQGGGASLQLEVGYTYSWEGSKITPERVLSSAKLRKRNGMILLGIGSIAMTVGAGLMIGEAAVKPRPGEVRVWSKTGCWISFDFGLVLLTLGMHAAIAGIVMLARGRSHDRLAAIMSLEGPGPTWMAWHSAGKGSRILGSVMMLIGTVFLSASLATSVPYFTCDRWECNAWPEVATWQGAKGIPTRLLPIIFGAIGAFASTLGILMLISGYSKQSKFLDDRHIQESGETRDPVALALSPGGLSLIW